MEKLTINIPEGYEIDLEKSNLSQGIIKFKLIQNEFDGLVKNGLKGYVITYMKNKSIIADKSIILLKGGVFPTKEQADSALALANLQQLMQLPQYNGDWIPDLLSDINMYGIERYKDFCIFASNYHTHYFLSFKTEEIRELFYKNHEELIKQYFMIK